MTDITELTSVQKNANIHRLSRLIAYASNDELRQMAVEVEHYTDQLIEALEKAQAGEKQWREVVDAFCADDADWHKLTNSNNELIALLSQALCKQADRIAELESRAVKLPKKNIGWDRDEEDCWNNAIDACAEVLAAAGIKVEAE